MIGRKTRMEIQLRANFRGNVQGVGFRFRTESIARKFNVKGYVQNMEDGTVDLVAEGEKNELESFLAEIQSQMDSNIRGTTTSWCQSSGHYSRFVIER